MDNTEKFNCISLCTGYAGIELGLERIIPNLRTVCYVEIEAFACANLVAKIEQGKLAEAPVWTDIKTFDGRPFRNRVHIITGGYPCQPFSVAGQRKGTNDPRHLWPYIERIIEAVQPVWCFFENVSGHLTIGFPEVYRSLRNLGYSVEAGLFTAAECGAPHKRERLFILAQSTGISRERADSLRINRKGFCELPCRSEVRFNDSGCCESTRTTELANTQRPEQGKGTIEETQAGIGRDRPAIDRWPSRPGQPQYEWEEPRVVADTRYDVGNENRQRTRPSKLGEAKKGKGGTGDKQAQAHKYKSEHGRKVGKGQTKPQLGRAASRSGSGLDATANRVDRLRLLGNGVVPQCAELAFRTLIEKMDAARE